MSRSGISVEFDGDQVRRLARDFGATEKHLQAALRSTYGKMGRWLRTRATRGLSAHVGVKQKLLRSRIRTFRMAHGIGNSGEGSKVWFGLRPIPAHRLGKPRRTSEGVRVGAHNFPGAFLGKYGAAEKVLRRVGPARKPLEVVGLDIYEKSIVYVEDELIGTDEFESQFFRFLEHELKWRTRILG